MRSTNHDPRLLVALTIILASTAATVWAKRDPPPFMPSQQDADGTNATSEAKQDPPAFIPSQQSGKGTSTMAASGVATITNSTSTNQQDQTAGESTPIQSKALAGPSAGAISVARWLRVIGGRISMGPKIGPATRVSLPRPTDAKQGWRVSTPSFAHARLVMPPARATPANTTPSSESTQTDRVDLVTEPATNE